MLENLRGNGQDAGILAVVVCAGGGEGGGGCMLPRTDFKPDKVGTACSGVHLQIAWVNHFSFVDWNYATSNPAIWRPMHDTPQADDSCTGPYDQLRFRTPQACWRMRGDWGVSLHFMSRPPPFSPNFSPLMSNRPLFISGPFLLLQHYGYGGGLL